VTKNDDDKKDFSLSYHHRTFLCIYLELYPLKYICTQNHRLMKKLITQISLLFIFVSCDFISDLVNGGEDTSELDYTYSKDHIVGAQFRV